MPYVSISQVRRNEVLRAAAALRQHCTAVIVVVIGFEELLLFCICTAVCACACVCMCVCACACVCVCVRVCS